MNGAPLFSKWPSDFRATGSGTTQALFHINRLGAGSLEREWEASFPRMGEDMNQQSNFETTRVSYGIVFRTNLDDVVVLKRELAVILERLPETTAIFQRLSPGRLMITNERAEAPPESGGPK